MLTGSNPAGAETAPYTAIAAALRQALSSPGRWRGIPPVWLAEAGRLLPEIGELFPDLPRPVAVAPAEAQARLFEALARCLRGLAGEGPAAALPGRPAPGRQRPRWAGWPGCPGRLTGSHVCLLATCRAADAGRLAEVKRAFARPGLLAGDAPLPPVRRGCGAHPGPPAAAPARLCPGWRPGCTTPPAAIPSSCWRRCARCWRPVAWPTRPTNCPWRPRCRRPSSGGWSASARWVARCWRRPRCWPRTWTSTCCCPRPGAPTWRRPRDWTSWPAGSCWWTATGSLQPRSGAPGGLRRDQPLAAAHPAPAGGRGVGDDVTPQGEPAWAVMAGHLRAGRRCRRGHPLPGAGGPGRPATPCPPGGHRIPGAGAGAGRRTCLPQTETEARLQELLGDSLMARGQHEAAKPAYTAALERWPADQRLARAVLQRKVADSLRCAHAHRRGGGSFVIQALETLGTPAPGLAAAWQHAWLDSQLVADEHSLFPGRFRPPCRIDRSHRASCWRRSVR